MRAAPASMPMEMTDSTSTSPTRVAAAGKVPPLRDAEAECAARLQRLNMELDVAEDQLPKLSAIDVWAAKQQI